jgi:hypothetical protein
MTSVGEVNIEEGISLTRMEYSVLKEKMEEDETIYTRLPLFPPSKQNIPPSPSRFSPL